jgi:crotonobetainyl-CoA:carnitine CoA-transferase CaiB-like acyl-CoA transferase
VELPKFWEGFCRTLALEAWLADPRLGTMVGRQAHKAELIPEITRRLTARTAADWETRLVAADVPCTRVRSVPEALVDPQALANGMLVTVPHPTLGAVRQLGPPVRLSDTPGHALPPSPAVGADTAEILTGAGYSPAEVARLRQAGAVR